MGREEEEGGYGPGLEGQRSGRVGPLCEVRGAEAGQEPARLGMRSQGGATAKPGAPDGIGAVEEDLEGYAPGDRFGGPLGRTR